MNFPSLIKDVKKSTFEFFIKFLASSFDNGEIYEPRII